LHQTTRVHNKPTTQTHTKTHSEIPKTHTRTHTQYRKIEDHIDIKQLTAYQM